MYRVYFWQNGRIVKLKDYGSVCAALEDGRTWRATGGQGFNVQFIP